MKITRVITAVALSLCLSAAYSNSSDVSSQEKTELNQLKEKQEQREPLVQLAILLDTSSSMDGLIDQTRTYLWKIINDMTLATQNGKRPRMQIALYEYGNSRLSEKDDYIRQVASLTDDLDLISESLFKLKTMGGLEYCGAVIDRATKELEWDREDKDALKMIFIAGNEPFTQGGIDHKQAITRALEKGITINTIYCGNEGNGEAAGWRQAATSADGAFASINQNAAPPIPESPYDKALAELSSQLNSTYIAYGEKKKRERYAARQVQQDASVSELNISAGAERALAKASPNSYKNAAWDLVDALEEQSVNLIELKEEELPDEFKGKSQDEIQKMIQEKADERQNIQNQIREESKKREAWIAEKRKEMSNEQVKTLDQAMMDAIRKIAAKKQFEFAEK